MISHLSVVQPGHNRLAVIAEKIEAAQQRLTKGHDEWIEGTLELAAALLAAREDMPADIAFSQWLKDNKLDFYGKNDRMALIGLAGDPALARKVLTETMSRSYQLIWRKTKNRFPSARKPTKDNGGSEIMSADQAARLANVSKGTMKRAKTNGKSPGMRIVVPKQYARLSDAVRAGIELERGDAGTIDEVLATIGLSKQSYTSARDIVLLAERDDLADEDAKLVHGALHDLDETRQVLRAGKQVREVALKVWGRKGHRFKSDKSRLKAFNDSISFVQTTCVAASGMELPVLSKQQRAETVTHLQEAIAALNTLKKRVGGA